MKRPIPIIWHELCHAAASPPPPPKDWDFDTPDYRGFPTPDEIPPVPKRIVNAYAAINKPSMKRYALFAFPAHDQSGGWDDLDSTHDTPEQALAAFTQKDRSFREVSNYHIVDLHTGQIVKRGHHTDNQ